MTGSNRKPRKRHSYTGAIALMATLAVIVLASVVMLFLPEEQGNAPTPTQAPEALTPAAPDGGTRMLAVVLEADTERRALRLYDVEKEENRTLVYSSGTTFYNAFGTQIAAGSLFTGDMVKISYQETDGWIATARIAGAQDVWERTRVEGLEVFPDENRIALREQNYHYTDGLCVMSDGKRIALSELLATDRLTVRGVGQTVYEIVVTRGHGTIALQRHEDFVGGTITIGGGIAETVTEEGIYVVPEGTYVVTVTKGSYSGTQTITVGRDEVAVFDAFDYGRGPISTGVLVFSIEPLGANLYIDGVKTAYYGEELTLDYGTYLVEVTEGGYVSYQDRITVDSPRKSLKIYLSESDPVIIEDETGATGQGGTDTDGEQEGTQGGDSQGGGSQGAVQTAVSIASWHRYELNKNNAIYILGPVGATIYLDGEYLGIAPLDFEKIIGSYLVTVVKENGDVKNINCLETDNGDDSYYNFDW